MQNATLQDESSSLQTTGYQFISALIALLIRGRRTVITAIYTQCDHDINVMHTYSMQQAIDYINN